MAMMLAAAILLIAVAGPLLLGLAGGFRAAAAPADPARSGEPRDIRVVLRSALLCTLAFNLVFFVQELFLVVPKALTPGLRPTLFHNNHAWEGVHPLANLFQGTGALATLLLGVACALRARSRTGDGESTKLLLLWMAYCGIFMALAQVVVAALHPGSDVGRAMGYFGLAPAERIAAALLALAAIPLAANWLVRPMLELAREPSALAGRRARTRFMFHVATLPALLAIPLILVFRVPREWVEVVMLPLIVFAAGIPWMQAGAWLVADATPRGAGAGTGSIAWPATAVVLLLAVFQLVLRRGIAFY